jgi:hypothetical protein
MTTGYYTSDAGGTMNSIHETPGKTLGWSQMKAMKREFELTSEQRLFATLKWEKTMGSLAIASSTDGEWTFKRSGFLDPHVTVRVKGSESDIAVFRPGWTGAGNLELTTGSRFAFTNKGFFNEEWKFSDVKGDIAVFRMKRGFLKFSADVEILRDIRELAMLVALGMYLLVLLAEDRTRAAGAMI